MVATDLPDVDRRGRLALEVEPVVPCRCMSTCDLWEGRDVIDGADGADGAEGGEDNGLYECRWTRLGFGAANCFVE